MRHNTYGLVQLRRLISHWSEVRHEVEDSPRGWLTKSTDTTEQLSSSRYTVQPVRGANPLQVATQLTRVSSAVHQQPRRFPFVPVWGCYIFGTKNAGRFFIFLPLTSAGICAIVICPPQPYRVKCSNV